MKSLELIRTGQGCFGYAVVVWEGCVEMVVMVLLCSFRIGN